MTSLGVIKVPDGLPEQLGLVGFFYPTQAPLSSGAFTSAYPALVNPVVSLNVYAGDLGIDDGTPRSVYTLDPTGMTQLTGGKTGVDSIELAPGETQDLPDGSARSRSRTSRPPAPQGYDGSVKRFVSLSIHRDVVRPVGARVRGARDGRPARRAVRAAPPDLGQGRPPQGHTLRSRVRRTRARRGPDARRRGRPVRAAPRRRTRGALCAAGANAFGATLRPDVGYPHARNRPAHARLGLGAPGLDRHRDLRPRLHRLRRRPRASLGAGRRHEGRARARARRGRGRFGPGRARSAACATRSAPPTRR